MKLLYAAGWTYVVLALAITYRATRTDAMMPPEPAYAPVLPVPAAPLAPAPAVSWYDRIRPHCNPVEVEVAIRSNPVPDNFTGQASAAACYALAGKIERATQYIDGLPEERRAEAASIVFAAGHPVADAGDDEAAGPIMELVVRYIPNHYMALYHAGIAQFRTGELAAAERNLEAFLQHYNSKDGWTQNAQETLRSIRRGAR
ncbi:MAG: hypothetical protein WEE89_18385 [Gemmatimonadota bacterium]